MMLSTQTKTRLTKAFILILAVWIVLFIGSLLVDIFVPYEMLGNSVLYNLVFSLLPILAVIDVAIAATLIAVYALEYNTKNNSNPSS